MNKDIKIKNFHCSEHGYIKPDPVCPKCSTSLVEKGGIKYSKLKTNLNKRIIMSEEEIKKIIEETINPLQEKHLEFLQTVISQMEMAFIKGMEVGKKLSDK